MITGNITKLSLSGVFISHASETLPEGSPVILALQSKQDIKSMVAIGSRVIRSSQEVRGDDQINSYGVKFEESLSEVSDKLAFILHE